MFPLLLPLIVTFHLAQAQTFGLINGGSEFFEPVIDGWQDRCEDLGVTCYNRTVTSSGEEPCPFKRLKLIRELIELGVDGIALKPCGSTAEQSGIMFEEAEAAGVPVVTFDSDIPNVTRAAYVGTNNDYVGRTLGRLLRQLRPEGGTFGLLGNKVEREIPFKEEITQYNDRKGWNPWYEVPGEWVYRDWNYGEDLDKDYIALMEEYARRNVTAIVCLAQSPMTQYPTRWKDFVDAHRHQNITYIGTDASKIQLKYLSSRYVDGLVGQLPYEMGSTSAQLLHDLYNVGSLPSTRYETNVVSYNLIPLMLPPTDFDENLIGNLKYIGYTCFAIVALASLVSMAWTFHFREATVVKAAQPFFLVMVAVGVLIMSSTLIPLSYDDAGDPEAMSDVQKVAICQSLPWLGCIGFSVTFSALLAKTLRVNRLFQSSMEHARIEISEKDVLGPFAALLTCNIVVLVCWTVLDPLTYVREESTGTDYWNRVISSYGACRSNNSVAYLVPLAVLNFIVVAFACIQAHQARDVESVFSEAKYIGLTVNFMCQAFLTGIPVVVVVRNMPEAFYLVLTIMIFILCMAILCLIFLKKVRMHRNYSGMTPEEQNRTVAEILRESSMRMSATVRRKSQSRNSSSKLSASAELSAGSLSNNVLADMSEQSRK